MAWMGVFRGHDEHLNVVQSALDALDAEIAALRAKLVC